MAFVMTRMLQIAAIPSGFWNLALNPATWQMAKSSCQHQISTTTETDDTHLMCMFLYMNQCIFNTLCSYY